LFWTITSLSKLTDFTQRKVALCSRRKLSLNKQKMLEHELYFLPS